MRRKFGIGGLTMAENKMEQVDFWIRYFKEHINTIGCVELDGLDCREVLALLQELADKKVDKQNKMKAVAQLFNKKLGEEFKIKYGDGLAFEAAVKFTKKNFRVKHLPLQDYWSWDNELLADLLTGKAVIVDD
jgi:isocitrate dehydrogenase